MKTMDFKKEIRMKLNSIKSYLNVVSYSISPKLSLTISYLHNRYHFPDFKNPKDLSEIIMSEIISGEVLKYSPYVDKVKVREYIQEWGLGEYLPKLYGVWDNIDEINFEKLPPTFALKRNNGCGGHYFCHSKVDVNLAKMKLKESGVSTYGGREPQYANIIPKIYAEELLGSAQNMPIDYKFLCCDGKVNCCLVCSERSSSVKLSTYSINWIKLDWIVGSEKSFCDFECPPNFDKMVNIAQQIAAKFTHVRVDLYNLNGKIYIGELTFTPQGGLLNYFSNTAIKKLGHTI